MVGVNIYKQKVVRYIHVYPKHEWHHRVQMQRVLDLSCSTLLAELPLGTS